MSDIKISELPVIDAVADGDQFPVVDVSEGATKRASRTQITATSEKLANKGAANGYAALDASTLVPVAQVPQLPASKLTASVPSIVVGRRAGSAGDMEELTLGTGLSVSAGGVLSASAALTPLDTEIMADSPTGYWKMTDASGGFQDSSGNGFHATTLVGSLNYQWGHLMGPLPTTKFTQNPDASAERHAGTASLCGIAAPWSGDITVEAVVTLGNVDPQIGCVFGVADVGETEAANYQFRLGCNSSGALAVFWEYNAGTNMDTSSGCVLKPGLTYHIAAVKDGTAKVVDFYINGRRVSQVAFTNNPTGGTTATTTLMGAAAGASENWRGTGGYVALYASKLSSDRIMAHAIAAGVA